LFISYSIPETIMLAIKQTITGPDVSGALHRDAPFTGKNPSVPDCMSAVVVRVAEITLVIISVWPGKVLVNVVVPMETITTVTVDGGAVTVTVDCEGNMIPDGPIVTVMGGLRGERNGFCGGGEDSCGWPR